MPNSDPELNRIYMREYMKRRYHERVSEARFLLGGVCAVPGCFRSESLEIDHIDWRKKTMKLDRMAWVSHARFLEELKLCQLLCDEHHNEKSKKDISEIRAAETFTGVKRNGQKPNRTQLEWPSDTILLEMVESSSARSVARQLGCSHASVLLQVKRIKEKGGQK